MALFTPSESPAITVKEVDLTGGAPNVSTTTGAFVGNFSWGPVEQATLVSNESGLVSVFGAPDSDNTEDFHSASYFLRYSNSLQIVRAVDASALNAHDTNAGSTPVVKNRDDFDSKVTALADSDHTFIAKYPGDLGNSLTISWIGADSDGTDTQFNAWAYAEQFDGVPATSAFAEDKGALNDEVHVAVIDANGVITGTRGSVLETFPYVSLAKGALNPDGSSNYIKDVINKSSRYVWMAGFGASGTFSGIAGTDADSGDNYALSGTIAKSVALVNGANSGDLGTTEYATGFDLFEDPDTILVDFLIAPSLSARADQTTVVNDLVATASSIRKDCIVIASPARSDIIGSATPVTNSVTTAKSFTASSYLFMDNNFIKVYDKYNDQYISIPAASSTAGIMAASDINSAPWFSPAGPRRGQYLGITSLAYSPTKAERDTLYKNGINPIANIPGQGVLLFGDKTKLSRPSAFDRINVRRLFLVLERAVSLAARNVMFEFNDEFTRASFVNVIEPFLREVKGRRGITDFKVVCDETNNTAAVIDRNEFVCTIFIKPARSINYVTLNFVAVRTGVDFEEVVGTV